MLLPQNRLGGSNTYKCGELKRRLDPVTVMIADGTLLFQPVPALITRRVILKGMSGDLNIQIAAALVSATDGTAIEASAVVNGTANIQLTPVVWTGNQAKIFLRPVFQDPFATVGNTNNPLPQDLPFGWEFSTEADEVYIDIKLNPSLAPVSTSFNVVVAVTVEYNGQWWDTKAVQQSLSQVQLTGGGQPTIFGTLAS